MIHIQKNDTLVDIIDKIQKSSDERLVLSVPTGHPILRNYLSLKILKSKTKGKEIVIVTNDILSAKIGKKLGFTYSIIKDEKFHKKKLSQNSIMKHNFSYGEYLRFEWRKFKNTLSDFFSRNKQINELTFYKKKYKSYSLLFFLFLAAIISVLIFLVIFYFAINRTSVSIKPGLTVKNIQNNFVFRPEIPETLLGSDAVVKIDPISMQIKIQDRFSASEVISGQDSSARGKLKISNYNIEELSLIAGTRFVTPDGIIFTLDSEAFIPAANKPFGEKLEPGVLEVSVTSKALDENSELAGIKANIKKDTKLSIPGLGDALGKQVQVIAVSDFTGAKDDYKVKISQEDVVEAKKKMRIKLKSVAAKSLYEKIKQMNAESGKNYEILNIPVIPERIDYQNITYSEPIIELEEGAEIGDIKKSFSLNGYIKASAYYFDKKIVENKLTTIIDENVMEGVEVINLVDTKSVKPLYLVSVNKDPLEIKATMQIDVLVNHDFGNISNGYTQRLKSSIVGLPKEEAVKFLINDPKIEDVKIEIRPFLLNKVSSSEENIDFEIVE